VKKALFSIHLIEGDDGLVTVVAEMVGRGDKCLDIGSEIMNNLHEAERTHPELLNVTGIRASQYAQ
jgi:hypothetical protein